MSEQKALPSPDAGNAENLERRMAKGIRRHVLIGSLAAGVLIFGLGGMAATIDFAGAVVAGGRLVVSSNVKKVQHQDGGTVRAIDVKDGDHVTAGQILVELDPTLAEANLGIINKGLYEALARKARLEAERSGADEITLPDALTQQLDKPEVAEIVSIEKKAFELRFVARDGQKKQLREKISELKQQLVGVEAQEKAVRRQIELTAEELDGLKGLREKDLVGTDRYLSMQRQAAQLDGQLGQLIANSAQIGAEIAAAELQILQIDQDVRSEASRELADASSQINELAERKIAAEDQLRKEVIRAPITGTVYQLAVHTIGGVVAPGEQLMLVVPDDDPLVIDAQVSPVEVDRVHPGQEAHLRFTAFGSRQTPSFDGKVENISPDVVIDERTGEGFYMARIQMPDEAIDTLGDQLVPGMPVEVFISTGDRSVLSYLTKPLSDNINRTFRER